MQSSIRSTPGPEVNGRRTTVLLFDAPSLATSPLLPAFQRMMNGAFSATHEPYFPPFLRLETPEQLSKELGPSAFTYAVVYEQDNPEESNEVLATVSGRPFVWREPLQQDPMFKTWAFWTNPEEPGMEVWELKLIVVDNSVQNHGLATMMLGLMETEARRRYEERKLIEAKVATDGREVDESANKRALKIVLYTLYELNGKFYEKRKLRLREKTHRKAGTVMNCKQDVHCAAYEMVSEL